MIPVNGFFEYGLAALLGAVGMIGLSVWSLITDEKSKHSMEDDLETSIPKSISYKKAA
jgi:hypothetical protein